MTWKQDERERLLRILAGAIFLIFRPTRAVRCEADDFPPVDGWPILYSPRIHTQKIIAYPIKDYSSDETRPQRRA